MRQDYGFGDVEEEDKVCGAREHETGPKYDWVEEGEDRSQGIVDEESFPAGIGSLDGEELVGCGSATAYG